MKRLGESFKIASTLSKRLFLTSFLFLMSCSTQFAMRKEEAADPRNALIEELRVALVETKQELSAQKIDLELLENKLAQLGKRLDTNAQPNQRLIYLEKAQERTAQDLRTLNQHTKETVDALSELRQQLGAIDQRLREGGERLSELAHLRNTLSQLTKTIANNGQNVAKIHRVRAGESLEKIARNYQTTIEEIKKVNGLSSDKIFDKQELKIP